MHRLLGRGAASVALLALIGIYGCDAGHGFVKDDFGWILSSRIQQVADLQRLLGSPTGFFRPIVSLSFALDYALFDAAPRAYGLTNLALLLACVGVLTLLFRATGLRTGVAVAAALAWGLNFQGINMAVLWISGRTALMVTFWSVSAAWAWMRKRHALAALLAMLAMWSKEEAFVLAPILTIWSMIDESGMHRSGPNQFGPYLYRALRAFRDTWMLWAVTAISLVVRSQSGAYTPGSAPSFYRYQLSLTTLLGNIPQYADRAATTPALALLVFWIAAGCPGLASGPLVRRNVMNEGGTLLKGLVWVVLGFGPTIFLPVRSSLYALLPSVGVVLIAGTLAGRIVERVTPRACARATAIMLVLLLALLPIYRLRNQRYVGEADLSTAIVTEISKIASGAASDGLILIKDVRDARPTAEQAFGPGANSMAELTTGGRFRVWIDPPPAELAGEAPPPISTAVATLVVERGSVRRE